MSIGEYKALFRNIIKSCLIATDRPLPHNWQLREGERHTPFDEVLVNIALILALDNTQEDRVFLILSIF
jgi:hypothetical protein